MQHGPFGISQQTSLSDILALGAEAIEGQPYRYQLLKAPKPHPRFDSYIVSVGSNRVAAISAIGKDITTSVFGEAIVNAFDAMDEALQRKYGTRARLDFLKPGSIWDEPKDWTMALLKEERSLSAFWDEEEGSTLFEGIQSIALMAHMLDTNSGYLTLRYEFSNLADHEADVAAAQDEVL